MSLLEATSFPVLTRSAETSTGSCISLAASSRHPRQPGGICRESSSILTASFPSSTAMCASWSACTSHQRAGRCYVVCSAISGEKSTTMRRHAKRPAGETSVRFAGLRAEGRQSCHDCTNSQPGMDSSSAGGSTDARSQATAATDRRATVLAGRDDRHGAHRQPTVGRWRFPKQPRGQARSADVDASPSALRRQRPNATCARANPPPRASGNAALTCVAQRRNRRVRETAETHVGSFPAAGDLVSHRPRVNRFDPARGQTFIVRSAQHSPRQQIHAHDAARRCGVSPFGR